MPALGVLCLLGGVVTVGCERDTSLEGDADGAADVAPDPATDTVTDPVTEPDPDTDADETCPHDGLTIFQIIDECVAEAVDRTAFSDCIEGIHASWHTGLAEHFACSPCESVQNDLWCLVYWSIEDFCDPDVTGEFSEEDLEYFLDNCGVLLYLGVRFE